MNERIRELAEQARQEFLKMPTGYKPEQVGMYPQLMERFAEFIVARCCSIADAWVINEDNGKNYPSERIKEYFGFEK